jgi:hypothetical protein
MPQQFWNQKKITDKRGIGIPTFGDGKLIGAGLDFNNDNTFSSNGQFIAFPARFYVD